MQTHKIEYFEISDGKVLSKTKKGCDGGSLPYGSYYDEVERAEALKSILRNDIYPFLEFISIGLCIDLEVPSHSVLVSGCLKYEPIIEPWTMSEIQKVCERHLTQQPYAEFELFMNIKCTLFETGTQLIIYLDKLEWLKPEVSEEYPVYIVRMHKIGIPGVWTQLDDSFCKDHLIEVYYSLLADLQPR